MTAHSSIECKDIESTAKALQHEVEGSLIKEAAQMAKEHPVLFIANTSSSKYLSQEAEKIESDIHIGEIKGANIL
jgi:hypothetical protein